MYKNLHNDAFFGRLVRLKIKSKLREVRSEIRALEMEERAIKSEAELIKYREATPCP